MEVICPSCGKKYRLSDEKVRGKTVKLTCKNCSVAFYIRDPALGEPHIFLNKPSIKASAVKPKPKTVPVPQKKPSNENKWYALKKGGKRVGPFTKKSLLQKLKSGELKPTTFMWNPGMQKWRQAQRIESLQGIIEEFKKWKAEEDQERTLITSIPLPPQENSGVIPPPLPDEPPDIPKKNQPEEPEAKEVSEISSVKDLFGTAQIPKIPEEPPDTIQGSEHEAIGEEQSISPTEPPKEPSWHDETIEPNHVFTSGTQGSDDKESHSDLQHLTESHEEKKFFTKAFQAPDLAQHIQDDDPLVKAAMEPVAPRKDTLREFSVLMRIERKTKKRNLIYGGIGLGIIVFVVGISLFLASRVHTHDKLVLPDRNVGGEFKQHTYAVVAPAKKQLKETPTLTKEPQRTKNKRYVHKKRSQNRSKPKLTWKKKKKEPTKNELAMAKKFGNLLFNATPGETQVKVKKKTVASMPKIRLDRNGMDSFLRSKTRHLVTCAKRKTVLKGQMVKLILEFTVANTGRVSAVKLSQPDGMTDPALFGCIKRKVGEWLFPKDPGRKPIVFKTVLFM